MIGHAPILLAGEELTLVFNAGAMRLLERETKTPWHVLLGKFEKPENIGITEILIFLWAGLHSKHPEWTQERLDGLTPTEIADAMIRVGEAISESVMQPRGGEEARRPQRKAAGTGKKY